MCNANTLNTGRKVKKNSHINDTSEDVIVVRRLRNATIKL